MCIIVYKPKGIELSDTILENCFYNNNDGASFSYFKDNTLYKYRGLMSWYDFKKTLNKVRKNTDFINTDFVFHFRISTENGVKPTLTHAFELNKTDQGINDLKNHIAKHDLVYHNGIINICRPPLMDKDNSDTTLFIKNILTELNYKQLMNDTFIATISNNSKFIIHRLNGKVDILNYSSFIIDNGVYYSNDSYSAKRVIYNYSPYSKYFSSSKSKKTGYNDYDTHYYNDLYSDDYTECEKYPLTYNCKKCKYYDFCKDTLKGAKNEKDN